MAAKRRKKKNDDIKKNVQITLLIIFSVLLGFLIFSESGLLGQGISTILGGLMSWVKYVLPIGIFILGVYLIFIYNGDFFCKSIFRGNFWYR